MQLHVRVDVIATLPNLGGRTITSASMRIRSVRQLRICDALLLARKVAIPAIVCATYIEIGS